MPTPSLPVDSAISCSTQLPKLAISSGRAIVSLSRPALAASPIIAPSVAPGLCAAGIVRSDAVCISSARSSTSWSGAPISAAGTRPKYESAEYRPPMSSGLTNTARNPRSRASVSSGVPGSVIATNCDTVRRRLSQK